MIYFQNLAWIWHKIVRISKLNYLTLQFWAYLMKIIPETRRTKLLSLIFTFLLNWIAVTEYLPHEWPLIRSDFRSRNLVLLSPIISYRRVWNMNNMIGNTSEQQLPTFLEHLTTYPVFSWVRVAQPLVFCVVFCQQLCVFLSFIYFRLVYCLSFELRLLIAPLVSSKFSIVNPSFSYGFWLPLLYFLISQLFLNIRCLYICDLLGSKY